jgi:type VI secretion system protein ImpL
LSARPALRPLLTAVGLLAAAALVWFVGPLLTFGGHTPLADDRIRTGAVGVLVAIAAANAALRRARAAGRNQRLMEGLIAPAQGNREVALLGERFEQAVALLRRGRVGARHPLLGALLGRPYVYQLPWYVIVGAPGAGKTTALVNSGLQFPLAEQLGDRVVRGVGGTRHCDWWFTDEAVLIDTAGRYTTHDSDRAADREAWLGFLDLLRRYRPRRPINGVLLTLSVNDLLGATSEARLAHAAALRARIDELHERLGIRFPIYVLVTKTDLLAGFMEFFADFDKEERAQVWGVTFVHDAGAAPNDPLRHLAGEFASLEKRLHDCMLGRLQAETDRERRAAIYAFPQQWRLLRESLSDFLQAAFASGRQAPPLVRGVYFTSATQEGSPMDRALGALARSLGLAARVVPPARPSGKTFFVTRLLRDVVFAEAGLAGTDLRWERRRTTMQRAVIGTSVAAVAGMAAFSWLAYRDNRAAIAAVADRLPALQRDVARAKSAPPTELPALVPVLDALQTLAYADEAAPRALVLDRREMLAAVAHDAYLRTLKEAFLPRIAAGLEARMRNAGEEHVGLVYEALRAYLMLFAGRNFDAAGLRGYLGADWDETLPPSVGGAQRAALRRHLDTLLAGGEVGAPSQADPQLVAKARGVVARVPLAERVYRRLQQATGGSDFSIEAAAGPASSRVFTRASGRPLSQGVPALYTRAVPLQSLRERAAGVLRQFATEQTWVLGTAAGPKPGPELVDEVERRYLADHARLWRDVMSDLRLVAPATLGQAGEVAHILSRPDSPLLALLRAVVREAGAAGDEAFESLRQYVQGQPSPAEDAQIALGALAAHLATVDDAVRRKAVPPASEAPRMVAVAAQRAPEPVRGMLAQL